MKNFYRAAEFFVNVLWFLVVLFFMFVILNGVPW